MTSLPSGASGTVKLPRKRKPVVESGQKCAQCGALMNRPQYPSQAKDGRTQKWRRFCSRKCSAAFRLAGQAPASRPDMTEVWAKRTPEERSAIAKRGAAQRTHESFVAAGRASIGKTPPLSPEQRAARSERMKKQQAALTPEQRAANGALGGKRAASRRTLRQIRRAAKACD